MTEQFVYHGLKFETDQIQVASQMSFWW